MDYLRGGDILRYDPEAPLDAPGTFDASWFAADPTVAEFSAQKRAFCRIASQGIPVLGSAVAPVPALAILN